MIDINNQIVNTKGCQYRIEGSEKLYSADFVMQAIKEKEKREKGCEYCNNEETEYQHTHNTKLFISTWGKIRTIITECNPCPPYAKCGMQNIPARSAFMIDYCPNCGRKLGDT